MVVHSVSFLFYFSDHPVVTAAGNAHCAYLPVEVLRALHPDLGIVRGVAHGPAALPALKEHLLAAALTPGEIIHLHLFRHGGCRMGARRLDALFDLTGHGSDMGSFEGAEQDAVQIGKWLADHDIKSLELMFSASMGCVVAMYSAAYIDSDVMKKLSDSMSRTDRKALACMVHTCNSFKYEQSINRN